VRLTNFRADADAAGRRIDISWEVHPDQGEILSDELPGVQVRRKLRDFEFPETEGDTDPFVIYDDTTFSADQSLPQAFQVDAGYRVIERVDADLVPGVDDPVRRRWVWTYLNDDGSIHHIRLRYADRGENENGGLEPGTVYYYQIAGDIVPTDENPARYRAIAQATAAHGSADRLYGLLPDIHQRYDERGELQRFVSIFGNQFDLLRSTAESLTTLHDVDTVDYRMLPQLAEWLGWDLNFGASIPIRRHEIKYATPLYRMTGTIPGCRIWAKRLTGWDADIKEFHRNVFFSNDLGNPDDESDHGSRTVDTSDPNLLANIGTVDDDLDYTYDTGETNDDWYAYKVVGIFVRPTEDETVATVTRKLANLKNNLSLFLPVNMRGVVVLDLDTVSTVGTDTLDLLNQTEDETG
jgi:phage tail-like protein